MGPVECDRVKYNQDFGNQNVIVFRDDKWDKNDSSNTLALTTVTFNPDTGEIYDADIELNTLDERTNRDAHADLGQRMLRALCRHKLGGQKTQRMVQQRGLKRCRRNAHRPGEQRDGHNADGQQETDAHNPMQLQRKPRQPKTEERHQQIGQLTARQ